MTDVPTALPGEELRVRPLHPQRTNNSATQIAYRALATTHTCTTDTPPPPQCMSDRNGAGSATHIQSTVSCAPESSDPAPPGRRPHACPPPSPWDQARKSIPPPLPATKSGRTPPLLVTLPISIALLALVLPTPTQDPRPSHGSNLSKSNCNHISAPCRTTPLGMHARMLARDPNPHWITFKPTVIFPSPVLSSHLSLVYVLGFSDNPRWWIRIVPPPSADLSTPPQPACWDHPTPDSNNHWPKLVPDFIRAGPVLSSHLSPAYMLGFSDDPLGGSESHPPLPLTSATPPTPPVGTPSTPESNNHWPAPKSFVPAPFPQVVWPPKKSPSATRVDGPRP